MICFRKILFRIMVLMLGYFQTMSISAIAQITSSGYSSVVASGYEYPEMTRPDSIYVFCNEKGNLSAFFTGEVSGILKFEWSVYDPAIPGFGAPVKTGEGEDSQISNLESGGYRVRINDENGLDTIFRAWIFVNSPSVAAVTARHDCFVLDLAGVIEIETYNYWDPFTGNGYSLPDDYDFVWTADPFIPVSATRLDPRIWDPPPVRTDFNLSVLYYSCKASFTITEDPVTTRAEFEIRPMEGEAPLEVQFDASMSSNAVEYEWYLDYQPDGAGIDSPVSHITDPVHVYYIPGEYKVMLRTISPYFCEDTLVHPEPVRVYPSELEVPNVFTPDGDDFNPMFMVRAVSLREYHALIFNRNGMKVFESTDPELGWDGKIGGNNPASPGVYFYVITGLGWDDKKYEFTGPLYLYRGR